MVTFDNNGTIQSIAMSEKDAKEFVKTLKKKGVKYSTQKVVVRDSAVIDL